MPFIDIFVTSGIYLFTNFLNRFYKDAPPYQVESAMPFITQFPGSLVLNEQFKFLVIIVLYLIYSCIIRKSKFPKNPKRSV